MKRPEMIIVCFVHDHIHMDSKGKFNVQFAGVSDKPSKLMQLQTWMMPHDSMDEATTVRDDYQSKIKKLGDTFLIIFARK